MVPHTLIADVVIRCRELGLSLGVAESCTGGLLGEWITTLPGVSDIFLGGVISYHNGVKTSLLGVSRADLESKGAVSESVATQMAAGVHRAVGAEVGVGITGIAGPDGGTEDKPVGTVWIAVDVLAPSLLGRNQTIALARQFLFTGDREDIRRQSAHAALELTHHVLGQPPFTTA